MTATVINTWTGSQAIPAASSQPPPSSLSLGVPVANLNGDWMIACVSWICLNAPTSVTMSVADEAHNWWEPCSGTSSVSSASGDVRTAIWMAPTAQATSVVYFAPTGQVRSICAVIYDVAGMLPWIGSNAVNGFANAATTLSITNGGPGGSSILFTAAGITNITTADITLSSGGWGTATTVTATNGVNTNSDLTTGAAFQVSSGSVTGQWNWTGAGSVNFSGVVAGFTIAATALTQRSSFWPVTIAEMAPGGGFQSPPDSLTWTPVTASYLKFTMTQGRQYEVGALSAGEGTMYLDNPAGAFLPPGTGVTAGLSAGTPVRLRMVWQGGGYQVAFHGNGSTLNPTVSSGINIPVTPTTAYNVSVWVNSPQGNASGAEVTIGWYTSGHVLISTSTASIGVLYANQILNLTGSFTSPGTAAVAEMNIVILGTPASTIVLQAAAGFTSSNVTPATGFTGWSPNAGVTITSTASWASDPNGPPNPTPWNVPYAGYIERLPQAVDQNLRGFTEASVTDYWFACNFQPQPVLVQEILNDSPYAYWPLTDNSGQIYATNLAPGNNLPMTVVQSKYGTGSVAAAFGQNGSAILGAQSTFVVSPGYVLSNQSGMWGQTLFNASQAQNTGFALVASDPNFPLPSGTVTIEFWFQMNTPIPTGYTPAMFALGNPAAGVNGNFWTIYNNAAGVPAGVNLISGKYASLTDIGSTDWNTNTPLGYVAIIFNGSTFNIWVNGVLTLSSQSWVGTLPPFKTISVGGSPLFYVSANGTWEMTPANAAFGHVAVYKGALSQERINTHWMAGENGMAGEPFNYRIERLLQAGNALGRRVIRPDPLSGSNTTQVVSCQDIPSQPVSDSISNITGDLLPGMFTVAPTGDLCMLPKSAAYNQAIAWIIGDNPVNGEIPYDTSISFDFDLTRVINEIQITQLDNQDIITPSVTAVETTSQAQYGTLTDIATGYLEGDATVALNYGPGLYDLANWLANNYKQPVLRVSNIHTDSSRFPTAWNFILSAAAGDMVSVAYRVPGSGSAELIFLVGRITQTTRTFEFSVDSAVASLECLIDPCPEYNTLTVNDSVRGILNGTNILGW